MGKVRHLSRAARAFGVVYANRLNSRKKQFRDSRVVIESSWRPTVTRRGPRWNLSNTEIRPQELPLRCSAKGVLNESHHNLCRICSDAAFLSARNRLGAIWPASRRLQGNLPEHSHGWRWRQGVRRMREA